MKALRAFAVVGSLLFCSAFIFGCGDACKEGLKTKAEIENLELTLSETLATPERLGETCQWLSEKGFTKIKKASSYADKTAEFVFTERTERCVYGRNERRCRTTRDRHRRRHTTCWNEWRCMQWDVHRRRLPGYEVAVQLSRDLNEVSSNLDWACYQHLNDHDDLALPKVTDTQELVQGPVTQNGLYVLRRTGCLKN